MKIQSKATMVILLACAALFFSCAARNESPFLRHYACLGINSWQIVMKDANSDVYDDYQVYCKVCRCYPSRKFGKMISRHVAAMHRNKYFDKISWRDFFHGHLLFFNDGRKSFRSVEEMLDNVAAVLYHTQEWTGQWEAVGRAGVPIAERQPRSIIGYRQGKIEPLKNIVDVIQLDHNHYWKCGTIHATDLCRQNASYRDCARLTIMVDGVEYKIDLNGVTLVERKEGKYRVGDQKYEIFIRLIGPSSY